MSLGYTFAVDGAVLEFFTTCSKRDRNRLLKIFDSLADDPFQKGDALKLGSGREMQVKRFEKWLVTFWLDDPVKEIKITDVLLLD